MMAYGALFLLAVQVAMRRADTERGCKCEVREAELIRYLPDKILYDLSITNLFTQINMEDRSARVFYLQIVLEFECFKNIV